MLGHNWCHIGTRMSYWVTHIGLWVWRMYDKVKMLWIGQNGTLAKDGVREVVVVVIVVSLAPFLPSVSLCGKELGIST